VMPGFSVGVLLVETFGSAQPLIPARISAWSSASPSEMPDSAGLLKLF